MKNKPGFTIVELLIVIVVIGILAAIVIVAYNGVQTRARDSQRAQDIASIKKTLLMYDTVHGGLPTTTSYGGNGLGGWNYSTSSTWLSFLNSEYGKMPIDPINQGNHTAAGNYNYHYYCYAPGSYGYTSPTVALGYWPETGASRKSITFPVTSCI